MGRGDEKAVWNVKRIITRAEYQASRRRNDGGRPQKWAAAVVMFTSGEDRRYLQQVVQLRIQPLQDLRVQDRVGGQRVAAERAVRAFEGGEASARLRNDRHQRRHVVQVQLRFAGDVDC